MEEFGFHTKVGNFPVTLRKLICVNCKELFGYGIDDNSFYLCLKCYEKEKK